MFNKGLKRIFDLFFSIVGIILFSPFFIIIPILIKRESDGPVLFKQDRIGINGKIFSIYKFRSMVVNAENIGGGLFNTADDPRVTRVGNFLRNTSLDEIPQFLNILKGDMSFCWP